MEDLLNTKEIAPTFLSTSMYLYTQAGWLDGHDVEFMSMTKKLHSKTHVANIFVSILAKLLDTLHFFCICKMVQSREQVLGK